MGRQIAAGAHRAFFRDNGPDTGIKKVQQGLERLRAQSGVPLGQVVDAHGHDGPNHFLGQGVAHAGGMAHENIHLQLPGLFRGNGHVTESPRILW